MKKINFLLLPAAALLVASCGGAATEPATPGKDTTAAPVVVTYDELQKASWLLGTWNNNADGVISTETWTQVNDSTYGGDAHTIANGETVFSESILLEERLGKLSYVPTVSGENEGAPVIFALTSATENELVFENPGHDFPQKITYTLINPDSMVAVISGIYEGQESSQPYPFKRMK